MSARESNLQKNGTPRKKDQVGISRKILCSYNQSGYFHCSKQNKQTEVLHLIIIISARIIIYLKTSVIKVRDKVVFNFQEGAQGFIYYED